MIVRTRLPKRATRVATVSLAAMLCACSGPTADKSQVVARVNESEITASQLRTALLAKGDTAPTPELVQQALDGLVNEQLLVDAALANDLDRDPTVVQAIEAAKRQLLARAYLERTVFPKQEISTVEQTAYYKTNPALFAQRRVYQLTTFTTPVVLPSDVVAALGGASTPDSIAAVLAKHEIPFESQNTTRAAEQLPLDQLPQFAAANVGDVVIPPAREGRTSFMLVTGVQEAPLVFDSAQPIIQQYLANVRNAEALDAHLKLVRAAANIEQSNLAAFGLPAAPAIEREVQQSRLQQGGAAVLN